jgi:hypothetical protein
MPAGRPSGYSPELADEICAQLSEGKSLRTICKAESMPCITTVFGWMRKHPEFLKQYTRAKEESADVLAEEMLDIADDGSNDWMEFHEKENVGYRLNGEHVNRSRLRVDTRKWIAAKLKPKKYGEKLDIAHSGSIETTSREALIERLTGLYATASSRLDGSRGEGTAGTDTGVPTTH